MEHRLRDYICGWVDAAVADVLARRITMLTLDLESLTVGERDGAESLIEDRLRQRLPNASIEVGHTASGTVRVRIEV